MDILITTTSGTIAGTVIGMIAILYAIVAGTRYFTGLTHFGYVLSILSCLALSTYSMFGTSVSIEVTKTDTYDFYYAAQHFYLGGDDSASLAVGPNFYAYLWSWFFAAFGPSPFLTNNLGILSFSLACVVVAKIYAEVNGKFANTAPLLFLFLSPATIFNASLSWREPHQILALALATLYALRYMRAGRLGFLALSLLFLVAGSLIHNKIILFNFAFALALFVLASLGASSRATALHRGQRAIFSRVIAPVVVTLALLVSYSVAMTDTGAVAKVLTEGGVQESLQDWRETAGGRTKFLWDMNFESPISILFSFPLVLLQFLVAPLIPFYPESGLDFAAALDGVVRVWLLFLIGSRLVRARRGEWWDVLFLVTVYLAYCALVALGTGNAGTALRHQIKMSWMLIVVSGPIVASTLSGGRPALPKGP